MECVEQKHFKCPVCGYERQNCVITGCKDEAEFEAWFGVRDNVFNNPTGVIQLLQVCKEHVKLSIAMEKEGERKLAEACKK